METKEAIKEIIKKKLDQLSDEEIKKLASVVKHVKSKKKRKKKKSQ